jgi:hypothetical protein
MNGRHGRFGWVVFAGVWVDDSALVRSGEFHVTLGVHRVSGLCRSMPCIWRI